LHHLVRLTTHTLLRRSKGVRSRPTKARRDHRVRTSTSVQEGHHEPSDRVVPAQGRKIMAPVEGTVHAMPVAPIDIPRVR
jgi:hypothetical protein